MPIERLCKSCGTRITVYNSLQNKCADCQKKAWKPIPQRGKQTKLYETWRDTIAKPYLDKRYGRKCAKCDATTNLDIDHKLGRGSHPELKMQVTNLQYLCRSCHQAKGSQLKWSKE